MNTLILDTETDIYNHGNPFDKRNKLVCVSYKVQQEEADALLGLDLEAIQCLVDHANLVVGFNFKFDYHWLHLSSINLSGKRIWDCQTAHYILSHQKDIFPSLDDVCLHYGLGSKLDVVKSEYWDRGITTSLIPWDTLRPYAILDAVLTEQVFLKQWAEATPAQRALILLDGQDCHVLREMEANGIHYDEALCESKSKELDDKVREIKSTLASIYPQVPINFNSGDHLSAFLYGGCITEIVKEHHGFYKTGGRIGEPKYKNVEFVHTLPQLYKPIKGSELKKEGFYATNEPTLKQLKGSHKVIDLILELSKLEKLNGTYYKGLPLLNKTMNWESGVLHGNFNQTQTATGRLSSSRPNQQNFASELQDIFVSTVND